MPQMAPLNWLTMFFIFFTLMMIIIIMNYFIFLYKPIKFQKTNKQKSINWKW
uniref:ATP synthase complex subunit 8 n=1 Tax=Curculionoidea sp. 30 KM-2017 TaxID=2219415 RepID=A0A346RJ86_9CUCU|nr:ATP synthase F0 subunit 8 [Curculionoidea sp. 30 KM-2017]